MILNFILLVQYSTYFYIGTKDSYNMNDIRNFLLDFDKYFIREMQSEYNYFIDHTTHIESHRTLVVKRRYSIIQILVTRAKSQIELVV